jgi:hypothetical protein
MRAMTVWRCSCNLMGRLTDTHRNAGNATSDVMAEVGDPGAGPVVGNGASTHSSQMTEWRLLGVISHERGAVSEDVIAKSDEGRCDAGQREDVSEHLGATVRDDSEVADLGCLSLSNAVPSKGDMFGSLPEAQGLLRFLKRVSFS